MNQRLDLLTRKFATTRKLGEYALAILAGFVDHVATLLLGQLEFVLHVGRRIGALACSFELGFLANSRCIGACFADQPFGGLCRPQTHLLSGFASHAQDPCRLLAKKSGHRLFIQRTRRTHASGLQGTQFAFQEALTFLQTAHFGRHHAQEVAHVLLAEAPTDDVELGRTYGRRRRRIRSRKGNCHEIKSTPPLQVDCGIRQATATQFLKSRKGFLEVGNGDDRHLTSGHFACRCKFFR